MTFFKRTRILQTVIGVITVICGICAAVELIAAKIGNLFTNPAEYPEFFVLFFMFLFFLLLFITLRCIVLDAREDIKAAFDYASKK